MYSLRTDMKYTTNCMSKMMKPFQGNSRTLHNTKTCMTLILKEEIKTTKELLEQESGQLTNLLIGEAGQAVTIRFKEIALEN
jgi:uncharacterized protein YukE